MLAGADSDHVRDGDDENLAVANLAGLGSRDDDVHHVIHLRADNNNLNLCLLDQIRRSLVLVALVSLVAQARCEGMSGGGSGNAAHPPGASPREAHTLSSGAPHVVRSHSANSSSVQGLKNVWQAPGAYNSLDLHLFVDHNHDFM